MDAQDPRLAGIRTAIAVLTAQRADPGGHTGFGHAALTQILMESIYELGSDVDAIRELMFGMSNLCTLLLTEIEKLTGDSAETVLRRVALILPT